MKVFLIFLVILIVPYHSYAADIEASFAALDDGRYQSYVEVGHKFDIGIRPFVSIATNMDQWTGQSFHPDGVTYIVGAEYYWKQLTLSAFHLCAHPIDRYGDVTEYNAVKITWKYGK